jgi:hypothetical protein
MDEDGQGGASERPSETNKCSKQQAGVAATRECSGARQSGIPLRTLKVLLELVLLVMGVGELRWC